MSKHYYGIPWRVRGQDCGDIRLAENIHDHTMSVHPRSVIYLPLNAHCIDDDSNYYEVCSPFLRINNLVDLHFQYLYFYLVENT